MDLHVEAVACSMSERARFTQRARPVRSNRTRSSQFMPRYGSALMSVAPPPDPQVQADALAQFAAAWERFVRAARRAQGRANQIGSAALGHAQYLLVEALFDEPAMPVSRLAAAADVAQPTATRMLAGLERDGIVRRRAADGDRRVVLVELTSDGRVAVAAKREEIMAIRGRIFAAIPAAQRAQAAELLDRLTGAMERL